MEKAASAAMNLHGRIISISIVILALVLCGTACLQEYDMYHIPEKAVRPEKGLLVTFDSTGGSAVASQRVLNGETAVRPDNPVKPGFGFMNWYSEPNPNPTPADPHYDFDTPVTADITLYAGWSAITHIVIFNSDGGTPYAPETVGDNGSPSNHHPTKTNYVFDGWHKDDGSKWDFEHDTVTADTTLKAKWLGDLTTATVTVASTTYTGLAQTPTPTVEHDGTTLTAGIDFTATYDNNTNAGTATVHVTAVIGSDYTGTKAENFTINPKVITFDIDTIPAETYTGSAFTPTITVRDGTTALTLTTDYTRTYTNNTNAGTATVTVTGAGNYAGSTGTATFTINQANGADVGKPTLASSAEDSITIHAVAAPSSGQTVEYAIATTDSTAPTTGWQDGLTFSSLSAGNTYYVWARSASNTNYSAGTAIASDPIVAAKLGSGGIEIDIAQIINPDSNLVLTPTPGVVLSHSGTKATTITLNVTGSYAATVTSVKWYVGATELTDLGTDYYTVHLELPNAAYNTIGTHYLTVEVQIDGVWYSKQITFEVEL